MSRFRDVLDSAGKNGTVENFMGGESYRVGPLDTLKMITASSIFGEPSYYREGGLGGGLRDGKYRCCALLEGHLLFGSAWEGRTTTEIMESAIDEALEADFEGTLRWAATLRADFSMRLNPQVIMVRAALHPGRQEFTRIHPGLFGELERRVMSRGDDALSQLAYFLYSNHGKQNMPSLLKRSIAAKLERLEPYEAAKYKNAEIGLRDAVRITHAHSALIDEFMATGAVKLHKRLRPDSGISPQSELPRKRIFHPDRRVQRCLHPGVRLPHLHPLRMDRKGAELRQADDRFVGREPEVRLYTLGIDCYNDDRNMAAAFLRKHVAVG
ncbi:hypothetical protein [Acetatifactor aquisgranensis]|uniref:hypothetical protein n=1 Tax=Acetatifactor aquisgranensis TaxID=2941233 RepID=UPI00203E3C59|nr:hypothetical protein [Acetatifactor aquisgranensis]